MANRWKLKAKHCYNYIANLDEIVRLENQYLKTWLLLGIEHRFLVLMIHIQPTKNFITSWDIYKERDRQNESNRRRNCQTFAILLDCKACCTSGLVNIKYNLSIASGFIWTRNYSRIGRSVRVKTLKIKNNLKQRTARTFIQTLR